MAEESGPNLSLPELYRHATTTFEAAQCFDDRAAVRRGAPRDQLLLSRELRQPPVVAGQVTPQVIQVRGRRCKQADLLVVEVPLGARFELAGALERPRIGYHAPGVPGSAQAVLIDPAFEDREAAGERAV